MATRVVNEVNDYIASCPKEAQASLGMIRAAIQAAAPGATERTDYFEMPGYSYPGFDYDGMFAWFSFKKPHIRLHVRPPVLQDHSKEVAGYSTTKAIVSFPMEEAIPTTLVRKLVKASVQAMKDRAKPLGSRPLQAIASSPRAKRSSRASLQARRSPSETG